MRVIAKEANIKNDILPRNILKEFFYLCNGTSKNVKTFAYVSVK